MLKLKSLYDIDFNLWIEDQAAALRAKRLEDLDVANLVAEIEDLAKRDKKALRSYLKVLLLHLLKWQYQPDKQSKSWKASISNSRIEIEDILLDSPSLRNYLPTVVDKTYANARTLASDETGLILETFPIDCPYELEKALDLSFLP
ncbi:conserved domain protein, putative [Synechococcus sp. PCC 7335]|uniref:DUF29 domain-containing protein n=1 Tax=Synechococcus sp. (strain ATCC 29403 / PCC 7335) TaxID=91464 RepID=UPI00017ED5D1|nr:DUF29 domain-containing protein [Synechococcus sp. PCC 7335]EDX85350.1 conserved domain protein, putative [Synechococcus sp. PCC 7335]